jgi:hypothetical protein
MSPRNQWAGQADPRKWILAEATAVHFGFISMHPTAASPL